MSSPVLQLSPPLTPSHTPLAADAVPGPAATAMEPPESPVLPPSDAITLRDHLSQTTTLLVPDLHLQPRPASAPPPSIAAFSIPTIQLPPGDFESMAESRSIYSVHSDHDGVSDSESIFDAPCLHARVVRYLHPGKISIVDATRVENPVFRRASQVIVRRPLARPCLSPIQPPKRMRTENSDEYSSLSDASSHQRQDSSASSVPSTPTFEEDDDRPISRESSPPSPETPKSSFEQDHKPFYGLSPTPQPSTSSMKRYNVPSRLRLFAKRAITTYPEIEGGHHDVYDMTAPDPADRSSRDVTSATTPRQSHYGADAAGSLAFEKAQRSPLSLLHISAPARSIWREAGRSRFLGHTMRRMESRAGLNVAH